MSGTETRIDLEGLGDDARAVIERAAVVARELGAGAVGTEHLLLGLMAVDGTAARALAAAGATRAAARHKAVELAGRTATPPSDGPLELTSRASRAIGRSHRFSHQDRAEAVGSGNLLLGVLDVEGTAGQVLRGIGVDVAALRGALVSAAPEAAAAIGEPANARCASCGAPADELGFRIVRAVGEHGRWGEAVVLSCRSCGAVLGVSPRRGGADASAIDASPPA